MISYIYVVLIFLTIGLIYQGILNSYLYAPSKIKVAGVSVFFLLFFRCVALLILCLSPNIKYLYLLKPAILLSVALIPFAAIIAIYIFARYDKIKFGCIIIIGVILLAFYGAVLYLTSIKLTASLSYGYIMTFSYQFYINIEYIILNALFLVIGIKFINTKYVDKLGMFLIIISSSISIISVILPFIYNNYIWFNAFSDFIWILTLDYGLIRLKKH